MLIKVNAYQALVWSSALLSFQKHCFNLPNAALPFVILFRDCVVKRSTQTTCCRRSRNCLQTTSLHCSRFLAEVEAEPQFSLQKCSGQAAWQGGQESQFFLALKLLGTNTRLLAESRLQVISCVTLAWRKTAESRKFHQAPTMACSFPCHRLQTWQEAALLTWYQGRWGWGRSPASCPSDSQELRCSAWIRNARQSCQFTSLPEQLNFAEIWRNPWD